MEKLKELLRNTQEACVITHRRADLDAYACGIAIKELLEKLGIKPSLIIPEGISQDVKSFLNKLSISYVESKECGSNKDLVILVDISTYSQINEYRDLIEGKRLIIIDHHAIHNIEPILAIVDPSATSCSEIIALIFRDLDIEPSQETAKLLIGGILSDSSRLIRARELTFEALAWLLKVSKTNYQSIIEAMTTETPFSERMAKIKGLLRMRVYRANEWILCLSNVNAYESSLAETMIRSGCDLALVASEHDGEVRMIGRASRKFQELLSLADLFMELAKYFGGEGGGHTAAAALAIKAKVDVWTLLLKALERVEKEIGVKALRITE